MGMGVRHMGVGMRGVYDDSMGMGLEDLGAGDLTPEMRMKMGVGMNGLPLDGYTRPSVVLANKLLSQNRKRKDQGNARAAVWMRTRVVMSECAAGGRTKT